MKRWLLGLGLLWLAVMALPAFAKDMVYYYYTNTLHSAVVETDAQGKVIERTYYAPYGQVLNRSMRDGPGYTGHEEDPATGLVYMQQRYYDPESGRFLSTDPVQADGDGGSFNRYEYANDNPYRYTDPDGRVADLAWTSPDHVTITVKYILGGVDHPAFTSAQVNAQFAKDFSGTVSLNGKTITVTARAEEVTSPGKDVNVVVVVPNTAGVTPSGRSDTNKIGGNLVTVGAEGSQKANATTVTHEFGHVSGAGDQYKGGEGVNGQTLTKDVAGPDNIMKTLIGNPANKRTMGEVLKAKTNINTCAKGVHAGNGGC